VQANAVRIGHTHCDLSFERNGCHARPSYTRGGGVICCVVVVTAHLERLAYGTLKMNGSEIIGLVLSVGLSIYLAIALLKPEWFA
jgi:K+-transporting ATPase KdpF subunit